jgi:hypothetical protein
LGGILHATTNQVSAQLKLAMSRLYHVFKGDELHLRPRNRKKVPRSNVVRKKDAAGGCRDKEKDAGD